jgi:peroxiredoxin
VASQLLEPPTLISREREKAPLFALKDHLGRMVSLSDAVAGGCAVVIFFRGHWCPYCRRYLSKVQSQFDKIMSLGATLLAISPEDPGTSRRLAGELGLTFPLLSDSEGETIAAYGVRNTFSSVRTLLPHPAAFVIDGTGTITFRSVDRNYKKRTTIRTLLHEVSAVTGRPVGPAVAAV